MLLAYKALQVLVLQAQRGCKALQAWPGLMAQQALQAQEPLGLQA